MSKRRFRKPRVWRVTCYGEIVGYLKAKSKTEAFDKAAQSVTVEFENNFDNAFVDFQLGNLKDGISWKPHQDEDETFQGHANAYTESDVEELIQDSATKHGLKVELTTLDKLPIQELEDESEEEED